MPINGNGAYVNPQWVNNSEPYINANELNAMSSTLQQVPIANGGTGATTAAQALTNLGAVPIANVTSKGSNIQPVYFDASGVAQPIQVVSTPLGSAFYSGVSNIYRFGKVVMITATSADKVTEFNVLNAIPEGYRPAQQTYGFAFGVNSTSASAEQRADGMVSINTSGTVHATISGSTNYYIRFTIVYISE